MARNQLMCYVPSSQGSWTYAVVQRTYLMHRGPPVGLQEAGSHESRACGVVHSHIEECR